jgi:hypothetical protein
MRRQSALLALLAVLALVAAPACARKYQAERDGKDVGEALCDVRDANGDAEVQSAVDDLRAEIEDFSGDYAVFTAEDRADIDENLDDLVEHVIQGNEVLVQQDITVITRSLDNISDDLADTGRAAIDGFLQGFDDCVDG